MLDRKFADFFHSFQCFQQKRWQIDCPVIFCNVVITTLTFFFPVFSTKTMTDYWPVIYSLQIFANLKLLLEWLVKIIVVVLERFHPDLVFYRDKRFSSFIIETTKSLKLIEGTENFSDSDSSSAFIRNLRIQGIFQVSSEFFQWFPLWILHSLLKIYSSDNI